MGKVLRKATIATRQGRAFMRKTRKRKRCATSVRFGCRKTIEGNLAIQCAAKKVYPKRRAKDGSELETQDVIQIRLKCRKVQHKILWSCLPMKLGSRNIH